jgi:hypothetical protein
MFVILPAVIFVIFWANTSVGPKPLSMSLLAIVVLEFLAALYGNGLASPQKRWVTFVSLYIRRTKN